MYQYSIDKQTSDKVKQQTDEVKSIFEQFKELDDKYNYDGFGGEAPDYKELEYVKPSEKEVQDQAERSLYDFKDKTLQGINSDYELKKSQLNEGIKKAKESKAEKQAEIESTYSKVKIGAENDAIKRGLARSSIIVNKLSSLDEKMMNDLSVLSYTTDKNIQDLNTKKNTLELEKNAALNNFDIEYAVKLQNKIDEINSDISKNEQAALKYNNEIAELKAKWERDNKNDLLDLSKEISDEYEKNGEFGLDVYKQAQKYDIARNYFKTLSPDEALLELQNNKEYAKQLGNVFYNKLVRELEKDSKS